MRTLYTAKDRALFMLVSFIFWFSNFIYLPILSPYIESLGGTYTFIGIVLSSYGLMQLLFRFPLGIFSDLLRMRRPFIIIGLLLSMVSCITFAVLDSLGWVLLARALAGVAAATWVAFTVLFSTYFTDQEVHKAMGSISLMVVLAQLGGMGLSGYIVAEWGWQATFWIGAVTAFIGMLLSFFIYENKADTSREGVKLTDLTKVFSEPMLRKASFLSILAHSLIFTTMFGFIPLYGLHIGLVESDLSWLVFSFMIPHAVATLFMGNVLVPLLGKWNSLVIAFFGSAFFTLCTPLVGSKEWLCIVQGFNGFFQGLLFPLLLAMAIESIAYEKRATAMGIYQALYAIGMFVGPFVAGILNTMLGIEAGFYFAGLLACIAAVYSMSLRKCEVLKTRGG